METKQKRWEDMTIKEKVIGVGILILILLLAVKLFTSLGGKKEDTQDQGTTVTTPTPSRREPDAEVRFNQSAFQITNKEQTAWTNCKLKLNSKYEYSTNKIPAQEPIVLPFREFTQGDGTRYDPLTTKAQNLSISCDSEGQHLFGYYGI